MAQPKLEVEVTADLVERATQRDSQHCMIAEAIKRADPENRRQVWVDLQTIRYTDTKRGKRVVCLTPPAAADALVAFDRGDLIEPFAFGAKIIQRTPVKTRERQADGTVKEVARRGRKKWRPAAQVIEGGEINIPLAHLGGTDALDHQDAATRNEVRRRRDLRDQELQAKVERGEVTQIEASSQRYRRYGLRLLKE